MKQTLICWLQVSHNSANMSWKRSRETNVGVNLRTLVQIGFLFKCQFVLGEMQMQLIMSKEM